MVIKDNMDNLRHHALIFQYEQNIKFRVATHKEKNYNNFIVLFCFNWAMKDYFYITIVYDTFISNKKKLRILIKI